MKLARTLVLAGAAAGFAVIGAIPAHGSTSQTESYTGPGELAQCANHDVDYGGVQGQQLPPTGVNGPAIGDCFEVPAGVSTFDITTKDSSGKSVIVSYNYTDANGVQVTDANGSAVQGTACTGNATAVAIPAGAAEVYVFPTDPAQGALTGVSTPATPSNIGGQNVPYLTGVPPTCPTGTVSLPTTGTVTVSFN